jgi:hypothetical protein
MQEARHATRAPPRRAAPDAPARLQSRPFVRAHLRVAIPRAEHPRFLRSMASDLNVLVLNVNGADLSVAAPPRWTLLEVLRYRLGLTGSKQGCDKGDCGACTVLLDGKARLSCITLAGDAVGHRVTDHRGARHAGRTRRAPEDLRRVRRAAMRLLPAQDDPLAARACLDRKPDATRDGDQGGAREQPLPLHRLYEDLRGGRARDAAR